MTSISQSILLAVLFLIGIGTCQQLIEPECDADFASLAMGLVQAEISDASKQRNIEAILHSCNKAMIQKMTEVSVFLLKKGAFQSPIMKELRTMADDIKKAKTLALKEAAEKSSMDVKQVLHYISFLQGNNSMSGNEKAMLAETLVKRLPSDKQLVVSKIVDDVVKMSTYKEPVVSIKPIKPSIVSKPVEVDETKEPTTPTSFPIRADEEEKAEDLLKQAFTTVVPPFPIEKKQEQVVVQRSVEKLPSRADTLGQPIKPIVTSSGRKANERKINGEDADLLVPRNSLLSEAVKFLGDSTNIPENIRNFLKNNRMVLGNSQASVGQLLNTFPLPPEVYQQLLMNQVVPEVKRVPRHGRFQQSDQPFLNERGLDRFDSHISRFSTGKGEGVKIALPSGAWETMSGVHGGGQTNQSPARNDPATTQKPEQDRLQGYLQPGIVVLPNKPKNIGPGGSAGRFETSSPNPTSRPSDLGAYLTSTSTLSEIVKTPTTTTKRPSPIDVRYPYFPSIDLPQNPPAPNASTMSPFLPYQSPHEITSMFQRDEKVRQGLLGAGSLGRPRFQNVDIQPEELVVKRFDNY